MGSHGSQSLEVRDSVQFIPRKPGQTGIRNGSTMVGGGCSTYGTVFAGNTIRHGVTQTNNPEPGPSFFWTDGIRVALRFNIPSDATGVLYSRTGEWEFQLWTARSDPLLIIKVTTSESREQVELAHYAVQKICNTEGRDKLVQNTNLEVMYNSGMFLIQDGSRNENKKLESLSITKGIYVWIHDGKLIVGGMILTDEFREIIEMEQNKRQKMKEAVDKAVEDEVKRTLAFCGFYR